MPPLGRQLAACYDVAPVDVTSEVELSVIRLLRIAVCLAETWRAISEDRDSLSRGLVRLESPPRPYLYKSDRLPHERSELRTRLCRQTLDGKR